MDVFFALTPKKTYHVKFEFFAITNLKILK